MAQHIGLSKISNTFGMLPSYLIHYWSGPSYYNTSPQSPVIILGVMNASARVIENVKKDLCAIFNQFGLKITIEANMKIINFLDVTLNLSTGKYQPYSKSNNVPLYVNNKSNHPPNILRNIPLSINKRLSQISSDKDSFNNTSAEYQRAIDSSGHSHTLQFDHPSLSTPASKSKSRRRNITWYNPPLPPFSKNVKTNIGQSFLKIIDEEFPTSNTLHKIFNRNTLKIS